MEAVQTMDLSDGLDGSTPINFSPPPAETIKEEKNVNKIINMESTPIADVMGSPADWESGSQMGVPPAPAAHPMYQQQPSPPLPQKANPLNLTDEQMIAALVGVVAAIASSKPGQEKLASMIPQVGSDPQGMFALAVTGLVAAILFYFGKRAVL